MTQEHCFRIADFLLLVRMADKMDVDALLPNFQTFRCGIPKEQQALFTCDVLPLDGEYSTVAHGSLLEEAENEMGRLRLYSRPGGYLLTLDDKTGHECHLLQADKAFNRLRAYIGTDHPGKAGQALSSLLRIAYSQAILYHDAVAVHASAVYYDGYAYLFMGKSGTGKSTHASLWMKHISGSALLNDDNPTLRLTENGIRAYGTPWSGKTPCYKPLSFPVGGIVRLQQAPYNRFHRRECIDAFVALYPGCSFLHRDSVMQNRVCDTLVRIVQAVPVGILECLPDEKAALLCRQALTRTDRLKQ